MSNEIGATAVDREHLRGDKACVFRCKKRRGGGDILRLPDAPHHGFLGHGVEIHAAARGHLRENEAGSNGIDRDSGGAEIESEAAGESDDSSFRGGVESGTCHGCSDGGNGSEIENASPAARLHDGGRGPCDADEAVHVHATHGFHLSEIEIEEIAALEDAGVVDKDVNGPESAARLCDEGGTFIRGGQVSANNGRYTSSLPNGIGGLLRFLTALPVVNGDRTSLARQTQGDGPADASG